MDLAEGAEPRVRRRVVAVLASTFAIVFGIFVAALAVFCVVIVTWAVRRDRSRWREWKERKPQ